MSIENTTDIQVVQNFPECANCLAVRLCADRAKKRIEDYLRNRQFGNPSIAIYCQCSNQELNLVIPVVSVVVQSSEKNKKNKTLCWADPPMTCPGLKAGKQQT